MSRAHLIFLFAAGLFLPGCGKFPDAEKPAASPASLRTNLQTFQVKGVVMSVSPAEKSVTIKHEDVPGYMPAMTMPFDVRNTNELAGLEAGDPVRFRLLVTDTEGWIDQIKITGPKTNSPPTTGPFRLVRDVEPLNPGDVLPDYTFTDQSGKKFSTKDFRGQALAIEFLFTRCPLPNFCPLMANNFAEAQKQLLADANAPTNWHLLTISFDPENDKPDVLKAYARAHGCDPARWTFATGELIDITAIGQQLGLTFWHENGSISHNLRTAVLDPGGRLQKIFTGNAWKPEELAAALKAAASPK